MARLPLEERLDVYHDTYIRSGHPKTKLVWTFKGAGEAGFHAAMSRMVDRSSFIEYFWIIHHLALRGEFDVCDQRYFKPLSDKTRQFHVVDLRHPVPIQFDGCVLTL